mmetsp:Transcript_79979/g.152022  ORF Transcript_79979/g.152022 Transcript_79979/m.152022 type:complete len:110 (+) Transcript_79979:1430-1759(+)
MPADTFQSIQSPKMHAISAATPAAAVGKATAAQSARRCNQPPSPLHCRPGKAPGAEVAAAAPYGEGGGAPYRARRGLPSGGLAPQGSKVGPCVIVGVPEGIAEVPSGCA